MSLHPEGLAPRIANLAVWRTHLFARLRRQIDLTADPVMVSLLGELSSYPVSRARVSAPVTHGAYAEVAVPFQLITDGGLLAFFSTTMMFGTPVDITLSELAIESFFPADAATAEAMRGLTAGHNQPHSAL